MQKSSLIRQHVHQKFYVSEVTLHLSHKLSSSKIKEICFFIHFQLIDVRNNRCFSGLSLISIILWEYCENIKTFWYYSYENKWIISQKVVRLFFWDDSKRSHQWDHIYSHKNIRENKLISQVGTRLKGWLHCLTSEPKGRFLVNNILMFGSAWCLLMVQIQFSLTKK